MPLETLTVNGSSIVAVPIPSVGAARLLEWGISDAVAIVPGAYTGETQAFQWPGADEWSVKFTLPPKQNVLSPPWVSWLMQMRGQLRATLICDPTYKGPQGYLLGSAPVVDSVTVSGSNLAAATRLYVRGLKASTAGVLLPGDRIQIGYRMHQVLDRVSSDLSGKANFEIWPSLRETPTDGQAVILKNPQGLFRLASNQRSFSQDITRFTSMSFPLVEYRGNGNS